MKKVATIFTVSVLGLVSVNLTGCAPNVSPNAYTRSEVGVVSRTHKGKIISKRAITIDNPSGVGGLAGAVAGGAAGSQIGGNTAAGIVGAVGGAVAAGVVGHAVDKAVNNKIGYEYIIKLEDGKTVAVAQEKSVQLAVGQKVIVIYGAMTRIIPDDV